MPPPSTGNRTCESQGRRIAAVDELAGDLVELLQALIRLPTVNPPGEGYEAFVADFARRPRRLGYATEVHRVPEDDSTRSRRSAKACRART